MITAFVTKMVGPDTAQRAPIEFKSLYMPDGQPHVQLHAPAEVGGRSVLIDARIGCYFDRLGLLLCLTDALKRCGAGPIELFLPYLPGARQDRVTSPGSPYTLRIVADLLNAQHYASVSLVDVHSDVALALVDRSSSVMPFGPIMDYAREIGATAVVAPDSGAERRASHAAQLLDLPLVRAVKSRDPESGRLDRFTLVDHPDQAGVDQSPVWLVVDDICDGGNTFCGLAGSIYSWFAANDRGATPVLHLWTTHGIYSQGTRRLREHYASLACTDSFPRLAGDDGNDYRRYAIGPCGPSISWRRQGLETHERRAV